MAIVIGLGHHLRIERTFCILSTKPASRDQLQLQVCVKLNRRHLDDSHFMVD